MTGRLTRMQRQLYKARRMMDDETPEAASQRSAEHADKTTIRQRAFTASQQGAADTSSAENQWAGIANEAPMQTGIIPELHRGEQVLTAAEASGRRQSESYSPAIDYERIAEAASQRPVVVYVDRKAAAALLAREMDVQIGNRNIQQLVSMGG